MLTQDKMPQCQRSKNIHLWFIKTTSLERNAKIQTFRCVVFNVNKILRGDLRESSRKVAFSFTVQHGSSKSVFTSNKLFEEFWGRLVELIPRSEQSGFTDRYSPLVTLIQLYVSCIIADRLQNQVHE